jgi:2-dehydro-3-deoxygluconokinase
VSSGPDVVVLGEILVELSSTTPFAAGTAMTLGFSGDALNVAAAAAAAGARTAVLTRVADDELGRALLDRIEALGVSTELVRLVPGQQGSYFVHSDPGGGREFVYIRRGSAASTLSPADVAGARLERAGIVVSSGVAGAISASAADAVRAAARAARRFVYDPNFRPRLSTAREAAELLAQVAQHSALVTPAFPAEAEALLGVSEPFAALRRLRAAGAAAVALTRGADGVLLDDGESVYALPAVPAPRLVDQTGAGDALVGTVAGRLALGDSLLEATRLGTAAASLGLGGQGGTGHVATLAEARAHLQRCGPAPTDATATAGRTVS